ncbi:ABC transporter ATP-binding protein [Lacibacter luteus]|uniref:ABC transporter ATP-binding protein n=1 Tax=Lacibacter luteus TaxID=2508719 RepID=A0A4Q1CGG9_9BACT|nr:ABC transporter ATP-binding protein [Lacibacter luteus]RXK58921.1 ABC transporter ATP-binding protein [Lacibacter luteus]
MGLLEVRNVFKKEGETDAVNGISFVQKPFEKIGIAGETGSGKTTLLKMIAGFVQPDAGEMYFKGQKVLGPFDQLIPGHPGIGYLSQHFELRNNYWVNDFLEMANKLSEEEASRIFSVCEIDHLLRRRTHQLSGGEKQRIALARLLITSPSLLILDEPFSNLDVMHKATMKRVVEEAGKQFNTSFILVSHDPADLLSWADTIFLMQAGKIIQQGSAAEVYLNPVNEYAAGLLGEYSSVDAALFKKESDRSELLLRPHQLQLTTKTDDAVEAIVEMVNYRGSHSVLQLAVNKERLFLVQVGISVQKGDTVYVKLVV